MTTDTPGLGILNSADVFTMPKEEALEKFKEYEAALRRSHSEADKLMTQTFKALSEGLGVINIHKAIGKAGFNAETSLPFLAVSRADQPVVWFRRNSRDETGGRFGATQRMMEFPTAAAEKSRRLFQYPIGTMETWESVMGSGVRVPRGFWGLHRAPVPSIPPQFRPGDAKSKYLIMWEVEKWEMVVPVDPMLLRPLAGGLAVVFAHWDLTEIERMVLGSLLGQ